MLFDFSFMIPNFEQTAKNGYLGEKKRKANKRKTLSDETKNKKKTQN